MHVSCFHYLSFETFCTMFRLKDQVRRRAPYCLSVLVFFFNLVFDILFCYSFHTLIMIACVVVTCCFEDRPFPVDRVAPFLDFIHGFYGFFLDYAHHSFNLERILLFSLVISNFLSLLSESSRSFINAVTRFYICSFWK